MSQTGGSTAGAGSGTLICSFVMRYMRSPNIGTGDFHTYRQMRRKEMFRLEGIERDARKEAEKTAHLEKRTEMANECAAATAERSAKRKRKKEKALEAKAKKKLEKFIQLPTDGSFLEMFKKRKEEEASSGTGGPATETIATSSDTK